MGDTLMLTKQDVQDIASLKSEMSGVKISLEHIDKTLQNTLKEVTGVGKQLIDCTTAQNNNIAALTTIFNKLDDKVEALRDAKDDALTKEQYYREQGRRDTEALEVEEKVDNIYEIINKVEANLKDQINNTNLKLTSSVSFARGIAWIGTGLGILLTVITIIKLTMGIV